MLDKRISHFLLAKIYNRSARANLLVAVRRGLVQMYTTTNKGLHKFVADRTHKIRAPRHLRSRPGFWPGRPGPTSPIFRLRSAGRRPKCRRIRSGLPHDALDFDQNDFASGLGPSSFGLVTAIEVIEHVESPIGFLRNISRLLAPSGVAVITIPNVDSLPARAKLLLTGKIRTMDELSEPTHISPVFWDLLRRQFLRRAGVRLREHFLFPPNGYQLSRKPVAWTLRIAAAAFSGDSILGDNHVLVLERDR